MTAGSALARRIGMVPQNHALFQHMTVRENIGSGLPVRVGGVPVAVKDLIATSGLRTTFGSPLCADCVPDEDDIVVERLKAAASTRQKKPRSAGLFCQRGKTDQRITASSVRLPPL